MEAAYQTEQAWRAYLIAVNGTHDAPDHTHPTRRSVDTSGVEQWRPLVAVWFPPDKVDDALAIIQCESRGDPTATNPVSSASGLWQFLRGWYTGRWSSVVGSFNPFNPVASMRAAAIVSHNGTDWGDWLASRHCHGL